MSDRLKSLLKLYEKDTDDSFVSYAIALEYISKEEYSHAEKFLKSLLKKDPKYVAAYMQLAQLKEKLNEIEEAKEIYIKGIAAAKEQNDIRTATEMEDFLNELK